MKVTYNWLKDFVEISLTAEALAEKLTMAGLEVKSLEKIDGDIVFEIEITSNRPDWLSVAGIAQEVAAITGEKLKLPQVTMSKPKAAKAEPLSIEIEDRTDCPLYTAKIIRECSVGPSPEWLRRRLESVGCRSINNIVDITNYIMFTFGEPLHAFDLDKLGSAITVRRAKIGEKIITIDGSERPLDKDILVIADKQKPVAIAGVMGGKDTEVGEKTRNILLEAAVFNLVVVRRGRQRLGLQSESSYRFERGIDIESAQDASLRAVALIQEIAGGKIVSAKTEGKSRVARRNISLSLPKVNRVLGTAISASQIKRILISLGLKVKPKAGQGFLVEVPLRRQDLFLDVDLIEEIARIFGYGKIPTTLPAVKPSVHLLEQRDLVSLTKTTLVGLGLHEVITYSLIDRDLLEGFSGESQIPTIAILNPLSKEQEILRPSLRPSLTRCLAFNLNQKQEHVNIFEIADTFSQTHPAPKEELSLGIALCGKKQWFLSRGVLKEEIGLLDVKGLIESLFVRLGIKDFDFTVEEAHSIGVFIGKERVGAIQQLGRRALEAWDIKNREVFCAELSLKAIFAHASLAKRFVQPPKYPEVSRDISVVLNEAILTQEVMRKMLEKGRPMLRSVSIADYYKGKQIPQGMRGITLSCTYRLDERTLTENEVTPVHLELITLLKERFSAQIR